MTRLTRSLMAAGAAAAIAVFAGGNAVAGSPAGSLGVGTQLAQGGPYGPHYGYGPRYGHGPRYGYRPYGVVSPGTVRLRLIARGYYAIRGVHYVPHRPGRYRWGPGAGFPGHYVAYARRLGFAYRFLLNPFTGRPYARVRVY